MNLISIVFMPLVFGTFTLCALGINAIFLGRVAGKPHKQRRVEWLLFALARAAFPTLLGLAFGLLGQLKGDFARNYTVVLEAE